ncbi:PREDICTED: COMM domain-containing protein 3-like [Dufourea novaeangliae]|uniref:COMM domain-containing protein 3 n=1 Tax=Dufourea novaeangliae TaxID=178035 RepID=A0A154PDN2_DUFNO|nr:PREDICTED: COMM domain-containing protein 3-like [Dufourea novaeangliae]KZC09358.1 COMM domain-containing protein 3 [Dufourea novaeangliae]
MELSKDVIQGLTSISNVNIITEDNLQNILGNVISHVQENSTEIKCIVKAADTKAILTKKIFADILCLFVEAARHDLDEESLKNFLCQACNNEQRRKKLCETYINNKKIIQSRLELISNNPPHIVDVDWHLDYRVKLDTCNSLGVPLYHIRLRTKEHERINHITFSCTIQQLQELVFKLKDAIRYSEKLTNV